MTSAQARPRTKAQMVAAAAEALSTKGKRAPNVSEIRELKSNSHLSLMGFDGGGYAVVSADDRFPAVLGVSETGYSNGANANFEYWLNTMTASLAYMAENNMSYTTTPPDTDIYPAVVGPLMTTKWDQLEPYNGYLPKGIYTGCVATAMAQVLNYFETPECGIGSRTIYAKGTPVTANFGSDYYDWDNMLDAYHYGRYSEDEANAVALLMRDCGVAANMSYGTFEDSGSGAFSTDAADGLRKYFGFDEARCLERKNYSEPEWMNLVYNEISTYGPIYYGGTDMAQYAGHAFVLHGYREDGKVYVNWGWSGDDDGYFDISLLNPPGNKFSDEQDMIIGIRGSIKKDLKADTVVLAKAGALSDSLHVSADSIGYLTVKGDINGDDLRKLRWLAGCDENLDRTDGNLHTIDLSEARFVEGGQSYIDDGTKVYDTQDDVLPDMAFYGCRSLRHIKLPSSVKHFGLAAFAGCVHLDTLDLPAADHQNFIIKDNTIYPKDDTLCIQTVLPTNKGVYVVKKGIRKIGDNAFSGCTRLLGVEIPASVEEVGSRAFSGCSALSSIRLAMLNVPKTGSNVFDGVLIRSCILYVPAGTKPRYSYHSEWGQFLETGSNAFDNIKEFGSAITARNAGRNYGEANPRFGYQVHGDVPNGVPEMVCDATKESPVGEYKIRVLPGTITDDVVQYFDGVLYVWQAPLKVSVGEYTRKVGEANPEFELSYDGFVLDEDVSVLDSLPVATCEAGPDSPAGEYPITISGGVAANYEFKYKAGVLTVVDDPTGISTVVADEENNSIYTIDGKLISSTDLMAIGGLPPGIYIIKGKKLIVK